MMKREQGIELVFTMIPTLPPSKCPLVDRLTRMMKAICVIGEVKGDFRGWNKCPCGAFVMDTEINLPDGRGVNPLAMHFLAYHRLEVPLSFIAELEQINKGELIPDHTDLAPPESSRWYGLL